MSIIWQTLPSPVSIQHGEAHLIAVNLSEQPQLVADCWKTLSSEERARANKFHFPKHKAHFIISRGVLRELLARYLGHQASEIEFNYQPLGKPELLHNPRNLQFNLSHSGSVALYGLTLEHEIGVDIEIIKACDELELAQRFFTETEYQSLLGLPPHERQQGFFQIWTQKEAFIKALGKGLAYLNQFSVTAEGPGQIITCPESEGSSTDWTLQTFSYQNGYKAAFATRQKLNKIHYWNGPTCKEIAE
jgi:4'-phosphopantetheinyl transferase